MGSISGFSSSYLQQALAAALQNSGLTAGTRGASAISSTQSDSSQLSPFAQLASTLQQLQQSDPSKYKQVTEQISTNLLTAAQTAQSQGNSAAGQLTQLANDFSTASQTGDLPNLQDLAQATGGGGHHHHRHDAGSSSSATSASDSANASQSLNQLLTALQTTGDQGAQSSSLDPATIILNTLASAGVQTTTS